MKTKPNQVARVFALFLTSSAIVVAVGCNEIDILTDCQQICDKYEDCFDADYDVSQCRSRCDENADAEAFADKVDACENCIDDKTCSGAAFNCATECGGIVP